MHTRRVVAAFESPEAARNARNSLLELGLGPEQITITDQGSAERTVEHSRGTGTFWAHIKEMFMPDRDRDMYQESLRRGSCVLVATVDDTRADEAIACLDRAGAVDLDERESKWRSEGWNPAADAGTETVSPAAARPATAADATPNLTNAQQTATPTDELAEKGGTARIPVLEERLRVGRREVNRGTVRVRSYIVEEPVHEEVRLREEHVNVERRPVSETARPIVKGSPDDLLQERTLEVSETAEQAVVGKEARVTEEVVVTKGVDERVEPIDDVVRHTKVEVEDGREGKPSRRP
jgi:uncharacterized protein (TIGR02271 family)